MNLESEASNSTASNEHVKGWREVFEKLEVYRTYQDDWDGQGTVGFTNEVIDASIRLAKRLMKSELPPWVVPGANGEICFEWGDRDWRRKIDIVSASRYEDWRWSRSDGFSSMTDGVIDEST
jgi:ribosomal protein L39E